MTWDVYEFRVGPRVPMLLKVLLHDQLMQLYDDPGKIITSADAEPQEKINAVGVTTNLAVSIVKIQS